jgi:hypothetical protein
VRSRIPGQTASNGVTSASSHGPAHVSRRQSTDAALQIFRANPDVSLRSCNGTINSFAPADGPGDSYRQQHADGYPSKMLNDIPVALICWFRRARGMSQAYTHDRLRTSIRRWPDGTRQPYVESPAVEELGIAAQSWGKKTYAVYARKAWSHTGERARLVARSPNCTCWSLGLDPGAGLKMSRNHLLGLAVAIP